MKLLLPLALLLFAPLSAVRAGEDLTVLPPAIDGVSPTGLLEAQLKKLAFAALDKRDAEYEKIKTPEDVAAWQKRERAAFLTAIGGLPDRTPLNARVMGQRDCGEYRMEKILFESQPGFLVSGLLYLPKGDGPHAAVLMPCGHTNIAKAGELYQRASISLCRAGLAVFCYDPIGQGERRQLRKADGTPELGSTGEHQLMGIAGAPLGVGLARVMIWDGMRALDYLQSRPDIRKDKLGCTGVSGGGTQTSYLTALDDRIAAAAPACYLTGFRRLLETIGPQDFEQNNFGQLAAGLDHADYVILAAPRPVLMMVATRDFFDIQGAWNVFRQAKRCYGRLGFAERVGIIEADTKHDLAIEMREASARWFRRWLMGIDDAWKEPAGLEALPEKEVLCTPEGDVLRQPGARSFFELNVANATPPATDRERFWNEKGAAAGLAKVRELARVRPLAEIPPFTAVAGVTVERKPVPIYKLTLSNAEGTVIPALLFRPENRGSRLRIYVNGEGKAADAAPNGPLETLARTGEQIMAIDLRGLGEMQAGKHDAGINALAEPNWKEATMASLLGRSLVGMRTEDIIAAARFLSEFLNGGQPVELTGIGEAGVPALHALALEPQLFTSGRIERTLSSWESVVRSGRSKNQQVNLVHGALQFYDLPDLYFAVPTGKVTIHEPVDAGGPPVQPTASRDALWQELEPYFQPPAEFAGQLSAYRSPLKFADGSVAKTPEDWARRRQEILAAWHQRLGPWPALLERPTVKTLETVERDGYTEKHVQVQIFADGRVADGYLLVPKGSGPFPAVFVPFYEPLTSIGRKEKGRGTHDYGLQLVRRGFVTLSIGTPGWEKTQTDKTRELLDDLGIEFRAQPLTILSYVAANCHTALAQMPNVDPQRIGIIGLSYGGKWTMFASCLYDKFACAVWSDPGIVFNEKNSNLNYWEPWYLGYEAGTQRKPGIPSADNPRTGLYKQLMEAGEGLLDLETLIAPRPVLNSGGTEDPPENWRALNHIVAVNDLLGQKNRVAMTARPRHIPTPEALELELAFLEYWLK